MLLGNFRQDGAPELMIAKIRRETLAEIISTTRSRDKLFHEQVPKLGLTDYNGAFMRDSALLSVVHDHPQIQT